MMTTYWAAPETYTGEWIILPERFTKANPKKIDDKTRDVVPAGFSVIGQIWKDLNNYVRNGAPIVAAVILASSCVYVSFLGIFIGALALTVCLIGKAVADRIRVDNLKMVCLEIEEFLLEFEISCENLLDAIEKATTKEELGAACKAFSLPNDTKLENIKTIIKDMHDRLEKHFLEIYRASSSYWIKSCLGVELQSPAGYFKARVIRGKDFFGDPKINDLKRSLMSTESKLGLIDLIKRARYHVQIFRCSLA